MSRSDGLSSLTFVIGLSSFTFIAAGGAAEGEDCFCFVGWVVGDLPHPAAAKAASATMKRGRRETMTGTPESRVGSLAVPTAAVTLTGVSCQTRLGAVCGLGTDGVARTGIADSIATRRGLLRLYQCGMGDDSGIAGQASGKW